MKKIVIYKGDVETTAFFLEQLRQSFLELGYDVFDFQFDMEKRKRGQLQDVGQMTAFVEPENTVMLSFNFQGVYGDDILCVDDAGEEIVIPFQKGKAPEGILWNDYYAVPYINIVVDHPYHYHKFLQKRPRQYFQIDIDRNHICYMKRYFPEVELLPFLPSAGTEEISQLADDTQVPEKKFDVVFTGTYIDPHCFDVFIERNGEEYAAFYREILTELLKYPERLLEDVAREHLIQEIEGVTEPELKETLGNMQFLDYYIRFFMRGEVVRTLVDAGIKVHVFGGGWENFSCRQPQNLIFENEAGDLVSLEQVQKSECLKSRYLNSAECLGRIRQAKISLNVMPWFRDGAHDRIFNSMLNHAVCVTDDSEYLRENLLDNEEVCYYDLKNLRSLPFLVEKLLADKEEWARIEHNAYQCARKKHTWSNRATQLVAWIEKM